MGLKDVLNGLGHAIERAYERRIRAASLIREYGTGGHGHSGDHDPEHQAASAELRSDQPESDQVHAAEHADEALVIDETPSK